MVRIFGLKREEVMGALDKLHTELPHNLYNSPNIFTVAKSRMRWPRHAACMREKCL
jgi:hypothetical protein